MSGREHDGVLRAWEAFQSAHDALSTQLDRGLRGAAGIPNRWYVTLQVLPRHHEAGLDQTRLAELVGLSQSATSRLVARLVEEGLVDRVRSEEDARTSLLTLTPAGAALLREARQQYSAVLFERFGRVVAEHDVEEFIAMMREFSGDARVPEDATINTLLGFGKSVLQVRSDPALIADTQRIREALEPLMLEEAAKHATEEDIADCRRILAQMSAAAENPAAYYRADWELHARLAFIGRNEILGSIYTGLLDVLISQAADVVPQEGDIPYVAERLQIHERMVDAVASGDHAAVMESAQAHRFMQVTFGTG